MRNLILFLGKYHAFFLFLFLEGICFYIIIQKNWYQHSQFVAFSDEMTGKVYAGSSWVKEFFTLRKTNENLAEENAKMRYLLYGSEQVDPNIDLRERTFRMEGLTYTVRDTIRTTYKINDTLPARDTMYVVERRPKYDFISAKVINTLSTNEENNFITLNKGKNHGLEKNMCVIGDKGLVGLITQVSDNFSLVIPIINSQLTVSAKNNINNINGSIKYQGSDTRYIDLTEVPKHAAPYFERGDTIMTKSSSLIPDNIPIGIVVSSQAPTKENFAQIRLQLLTNFSTMKYVYCMKNKMAEEQHNLENKVLQTGDH